MIEKESFRKRLETLVDDSGVRSFSRKCGVDDKSIRRYLKGDSEPTLKNLLKIAQACGVRVGWLAAGEDPKISSENGEIATTIGPGDDIAKAKIIQQQNKPTSKTAYLRQIVEWMDETFGGGEEAQDQGLFFYDDLKNRYDSFEKFLAKKRPSQNSAPTTTQHSNRQTGT